jgi:predicted transcriptional regulator
MVTMNISLDDELVKRLQELAKKQGTTVERVVAAAARGHVESAEGLLADIQAGIAEADQGLGSSVDDVRARLSPKLFGGSTR